MSLDVARPPVRAAAGRCRRVARGSVPRRNPSRKSAGLRGRPLREWRRCSDAAGLAAAAASLRKRWTNLLARERPGQNHLHRDDAVQAHLPRSIDHAHAAAGDLFQQFVIAELSSRARKHGLDMLMRRRDCLRLGGEAEDAIGTRIRRCVRREFHATFWASEHDQHRIRDVLPRHWLHRRNSGVVTGNLRVVRI